MLKPPILVADIGGTNMRLGVLPDLRSRMTQLWVQPTSRFSDARAALREFLQTTGHQPRSALLAVAGHVSSGRAHLTNAGLTFDAQALAEEFRWDRVEIVNDFVPVAAAIPYLSEADIAPLGPGRVKAPGIRVALGPGTGLGAAALIPLKDRFLMQATEAGHISFGAVNVEEHEIWLALDGSEARMSAETLLSGKGLVRLYGAVAKRRHLPRRLIHPHEITGAALSGADAIAVEVLQIFARLLGRFAGDLALVFQGTGGIFLAGGIAPRLVSLLRDRHFRQGFEDKAPFAEFMRAIPTFVITRADPAIVGLSAMAREPNRFVVLDRSLA